MMKQLNNQKLRACCALLIYRLEEGPPSNPYGSPEQPEIRHFVTQHDITDKGGWGTGRPLTRDALMALCEMVSPSLSELVFLDGNVLAYLPGMVMLWWVPAGRRYLSFNEGTKVKSGMAPVPATILMATPGNLSTWALKENKRPSLDTMLYNSPFFNVHEGGGCCMGNINVPKDVRIEGREAWEMCLFNGTMSTHLPPRLNGVTAMDLWNGLTSRRKAKFPVERLTPCRPFQEVFELVKRRFHV